MRIRQLDPWQFPTRKQTEMTSPRVYAALIAAAAAVLALPSAASAGCYSCYTPPPPPCATCYQRQVVPPQYRTVDETVMVSPGSVIAHRTPAQYRTVMVPQTVMVAPEVSAIRASAAAIRYPPAGRDGRAGAGILRRGAAALRLLRVLKSTDFMIRRPPLRRRSLGEARAVQRRAGRLELFFGQLFAGCATSEPASRQGLIGVDKAAA
jgi:hypothetical protein